MRLIDADALKKEVLGLPNCYNGFSDTYDKACIIGVIDEQPTAEVTLCHLDSPCEYQNANIAMPTAEKVKRGRWVKLDMHPHLADHKCTACGESAYVPTCMGEPMYLFCPNCGALMREGGEEG